MPFESLLSVIDRLALTKDVKGVFTTGTTATGLGPSSDIDLVVILDKNEAGVKSAYTIIENRFADIFFFDLEFVNKLLDLKNIPANGFEGIFLTWLTKGEIKKDETGLLTSLKTISKQKSALFEISTEEKQDIWFKINYNFIANKRYFSSGEELYHKALEMRLLYSVSELIVGYFTLRDLPWRGEKHAVSYFEEHEKELASIFSEFCMSYSLSERFQAYEKLFHKALHGEFRQWNQDFLIVKNAKNQIDLGLNKSVQELMQSVPIL